MNYEMAVTKPKSTGKYSSKKSGVNGHSMAHERVYSGGGREDFFFRRTRSNRSAIVCCYDTQILRMAPRIYYRKNRL